MGNGIDRFGHFYLQSPPINIISGSWQVDNIRPLEEAVRIEFIKVDESTNSSFLDMVRLGKWGNFSLKSKYESLGNIELM
jgi:hypothetical protein